MSVRRVMGTETEYAVSAPGQGRYNPVQLSFDVVGAASDASRSHIRWDYRQEDPSTTRAAPDWNVRRPTRTCSPTPHSSTSPT